jgi:DNA-binding transcriptional LysR family regulator
MDLLGDLVLFDELAELGSFSAVARRRGQAVSSISRRLERLETHLGQRLFNRAPTGLFLTAAGARKLAEARTVVRTANAFAETGEGDGSLSGHIVVSAPSRLGILGVAPVVSEFLKENPRAAIDLHLTDTFLDLDRDKIDLAIRIGGSAPDHYLIRRIAKNTRILVASPAYLSKRGPIDEVEALDECDGLMLGSSQVWTLKSVKGKTYAARPNARVKCIAGDILLALCEAGLGIALKSAWDTALLLREGRLVRVLPEWQQAGTSDIMLVLPDRRLLSPTLRVFEKHLANHLKNLTLQA